MSKDLRKKRDENFLEFAKKYQEKISNITEPRDKQGGFNNVMKTIKAIEGRINLLLPRDFQLNNEEIICFRSPFGIWSSEEYSMSDESDYERILSDNRMNEISEGIIAVIDNINDEAWNISCRLESLRDDRVNKGAVIGTLENKLKSLEKKYRKCVETLYDLQEHHTIFETFSDTEAKLYEMLLDYIGFWTIESDKVSGMAIKNDGWGIVEESKRQEIFDLFSKAVRDNREKWKLSEDDLNTVYNNMFDEKLNKIISIKEYLIELGMPDVWIKIIEESSADNNDFRIKLKKLERTLKGLGISLEMLDGLAEKLTMENVMDMIEMAERKR